MITAQSVISQHGNFTTQINNMEKVFVLCDNIISNQANSAVRFSTKYDRQDQASKATIVQIVFPDPIPTTKYIPGKEYEITISESEKPAITGL